jgi:glycolate oxidase
MTSKTNVGLLPAAAEALSDAMWAYLMGGSGTEATLRRNRLAFEHLAFLPWVLRDVSSVNAGVNVLGMDLRLPVIMAPVGTLEAFHPDGAPGVVEACDRFGTLPVVGAIGTDPHEIASVGNGPKAYQIYSAGDRDWMRETVESIRDAGFRAIVFTVDVASRARRERQMRAGAAFEGKRPPDRRHLAMASWADVEALRSMTDLPILIKGVQRAEDAETAVKVGVDGVWVSNHGGRQLDHSRASIEALVDVVQAVGDQTTIVVDGGIQTGADVLKALALGADLVAVGKLQCLALTTGGAAGVESMLEVLEDEVLTQMGLLGIRDVSELGPDLLRQTISSELPDPTDAWSYLR